MQTLTDANAMQVSLHVPLIRGAPPKLDPEAHATYVPETGSLLLVASHLDPLQPAKTYELWLLPAEEGQTPIPAGLFKPDANGNATVVMPELPKSVVAKGFGVTVEDEAGSKTPTAPIVLAGM
jgi:anti-sigma-K factor RskA